MTRRMAAMLMATVTAFVLSVALAGAVVTTQGDDKRSKKEFVDDEILVKFKPRAKADVISRIYSRLNVRASRNMLERFRGFDGKPRMGFLKKRGLDRLHLLKIPKTADLHAVIRELKDDPNVEYAEPNFLVHVEVEPSDPYFSELWGLHNTGQTGGTADADIDAPEAWDTQTGSDDVLIAVIDSGVDYNHEDLAPNTWTNAGEIPDNGVDDDGNGFVDDVKGWDFCKLNDGEDDNDPMDDMGHGTHCAGIIAAVGNNKKGVVGVNWNARILPVKFLDQWGYGSTDDAVESIFYATLMGVDIMSNSWGGGDYSQALADAIGAANAAGILFVAAAGNRGLDNDMGGNYPSGYDFPNVVAVAATDHDDQKAIFSNYGAETVDLGAPGVAIYSTVPTGDCELCDSSGYLHLNGTSMATPYVAGVAGLLKAQFPQFTSSEIKARLLSTVDALPGLDEKSLTGGRVNAAACFEVDDVPPSEVTDLAASDSTFYSITLAWTSTGDDGNEGLANGYDLRYATSLITEANWDAAARAVGEPKPQPSGSVEGFTVKELLSGTTYYFAMKVFDNGRNYSALSNMTSGVTTTPTIVFMDDMESEPDDGWTHAGLRYVSWEQGWFDVWEWGVPAYAWGSLPAYSGLNIWATNLDGDYSVPGIPMGNEIECELISPPVDLSGLGSAYLTFRHHYFTETDLAMVPRDGGIVQISIDQGSTWTQIAPIDGYPGVLHDYNVMGPVPAYGGYSGSGWHQAIFDISEYVGNAGVHFRFLFGTDFSLNNYPGWYIDDVAVLDVSAPPAADTMHVHNIEMSLQIVKNRTSAVATVTVVDGEGDPVGGATVSGHWSGLTHDLDADSTDSDGQVTLESDRVRNANGTFTFTVDSVGLEGWEYRPEENVEVSDSITVP
jgi:subtilisin family serine protease